LAFHGLEETHDRFICRRGAFRDLIEAAKAGLEAGLVPVFQFFITKRNVQQWPALFDQLKREGLLARSERSLSAGLISPYGYAEVLEAERIETADLLKLSEDERKRMPCRPEAEWCHEALEGDHKLFALGDLTNLSLQVRGNREVFNSLFNPPVRLGTLETDSLDTIVARYRESQSRHFWRSISDEIEQKGRSLRLVDLSRKYGQPNSQKLYRVASHAMKAWMLRSGKGSEVIQ
jgi:MoaA/NifB/PqqE/SkfB family radical SAM enzyme